MRRLLLLYLLIHGITLQAQISAPVKAKMDSLFARVESANQAMGSVVLYRNGTILYQRSMGYQSGTGAVINPATAATRYRIGSISKMFTATLIYKAISEGKLSLENPLSQWFPQIPLADSITINKLLNHHSGIHDITSDTLYARYEKTGIGRDRLIQLIAEAGSDFTPGIKASYSNSGYILLSLILESIYNQPYEKLVAQKITRPLKLPSIEYYGVPAKKDEALSYRYHNRWMPELPTHPSIPQGAGGLIATPLDLALFAEALYTHKILPPSQVKDMQKLEHNYGKGMFRSPFYNFISWGHNGKIDEFSSSLGFFPQDSLVFAVCLNGCRMEMNDLLMGVLSVYYQYPYILPVFNEFTPNSAHLNSYTGTFISEDIPLKIEVTNREGHLYIQAEGQSAFRPEPVNEHVFEFKPAGIKMEFNPDGKSFGLQQGGRTYHYVKSE